MNTFVNSRRQQSIKPDCGAQYDGLPGHIGNPSFMNSTGSPLLQQLLRDLRYLSAPVRSPHDGASIEGAHFAELPAILKLSPVAQAAVSAFTRDDDPATGRNSDGILLVKTVERMLGRCELMFTEGRLQHNHEVPVGTSINSTFTIPMVRG